MRWPGEAPPPRTVVLSPQVQQERDELYRKFSAAILEVQQKTGFQNLLLERKLQALSAAVEKKEAQVSEVLATSNLDPAALTLVSRKLEVGPGRLLWGWGWASPPCSCPQPAAWALVGGPLSWTDPQHIQHLSCQWEPSPQGGAPRPPSHVFGSFLGSPGPSSASQHFGDPEPMAPAVRWALLSLPGAGPRTSGPELLGHLAADPDTGLGDSCVPRTLHAGH